MLDENNSVSVLVSMCILFMKTLPYQSRHALITYYDATNYFRDSIGQHCRYLSNQKQQEPRHLMVCASPLL